MEHISKVIYSTIGMVFYGFITGKPYSLDLLRNYIQILNGLQLQGLIDFNTYEYYLDVLEKAIEFFEP